MTFTPPGVSPAFPKQVLDMVRTVSESPTDWDLLRVCADLLDDHGLHAGALAFRWLADSKKQADTPNTQDTITLSFNEFGWCLAESSLFPAANGRIPCKFFDRLTGGRYDNTVGLLTRQYKSGYDTYLDLALSLGPADRARKAP